MMIEDIRLKVGEAHRLGRGFLFFGQRKLIYAGMVSPDTYSLAVRNRDGYHAYAYNLFIQKDTQEMEVEGYRLRIKCVSAQEFWCESLGRPAKQEKDVWS